MEFLTVITAQKRMRSATLDMRERLKDIAPKNMADKFEEIEIGQKEISDKTRSLLSAFGMRFSDTKLCFVGRLIPAPRLVLGDAILDRSDNRHFDYSFLYKGCKLAEPTPTEMRWGYLVLANINKQQVGKCLHALKTTGREMGMNLATPFLKFGYRQLLVTDMIEFYNEMKKCDLMMVIKKEATPHQEHEQYLSWYPIAVRGFSQGGASTPHLL